jgi:hypothetical protein
MNIIPRHGDLIFQLDVEVIYALSVMVIYKSPEIINGIESHAALIEGIYYKAWI